MIAPNFYLGLLALCSYLKKFGDNIMAIYQRDDQEVKDVVQAALNIIIGNFVQILEKERGKGDTNCQLPNASTNPSEFKSLMLPILKAIESLDQN